MEIPLRDTPALRLIERGLGAPDTDPEAVADCMQLLRVSKRLLEYFYRHFVARDISPGKYSILCELLAADGPVSPSSLAGRIGVRRPTVTGLLDGLGRQGLVTRTFDPEDRRRVLITLTRRGERFIRELLPEQYALMSEVVGALGHRERTQLRQVLRQLEENLA